MRLIGILIALSLAISLAWGFAIGAQPAPPRPQDMTVQVDQAWYDALPADPARAARAYLDRVPEEMRARGEAIANTRYWVFAAHIAMVFGFGALILFSGAAADVRDRITKLTKNQHLQAALFAIIFLVALFALMMPIDVYRYVRARTFGFADQPFAQWFGELALDWLINTIFYTTGLVAVYAIMRRAPRTWVFWAGGVYAVLVTFFVLISPSVIEPLFNKLSPLAEGQLREDILSLARANDVPVSEIAVSDASRQSRLFNAHVSGLFGAARITMNDTTMTSQNEPGIRWVMGHEIGHYVMGHIPQGIVVSSVVMVIGFALLSWIMGVLVARFGERWRAREISDIALIPLLWCLFLLWGDLGAPITNAYTRSQEIAADIYGLNASDEPNGMAEFSIHDADTQRLTPTPLDIFLFYDHPSDKARVEMAMRWRAEHFARPPAP